MSDIINIKDFYDHEKRITIVENAICQINSNLSEIKTELKEMRYEFLCESRTQFRWLMGFIFGLYGIAITALITAVFKLS